jgi:hypothetical protein
MKCISTRMLNIFSALCLRLYAFIREVLLDNRCESHHTKLSFVHCHTRQLLITNKLTAGS